MLSMIVKPNTNTISYGKLKALLWVEVKTALHEPTSYDKVMAIYSWEAWIKELVEDYWRQAS